MQVFVVDDHEVTLRFLSEHLVGIGHEVKAFSSSLEVIEAIASHPSIDFLICDWVMPEADGIEVCRVLRQLPQHSNTFVAMLTSKDDRSSKETALASGVDCFLQKPVDLPELDAVLGVVQRHLDQIQEIRETREHLKELIDELNERNHELANAQQETQRALQAKQDFLAQMSHELRTPMQAVLTTFDVLRDTRLRNNQEKLVEVAESSTQNLLRILNDILDLSKIEHGKMTFQKVEFDLSKVLYDALASLRLTALSRGLSFECYCEEAARFHVIGDPGRLAQILINLVGNSLKFTEEGGIKVILYTDSEAPENLCFQVVDTGIGIPEEKLEEVFKPFVQLGNASPTVTPGTGLGLPLCRHMAEEMGGSLTATSKENVGTTVTLILPLPPSTLPTEKLWPIQGKTYELEPDLVCEQLLHSLRCLELNRDSENPDYYIFASVPPPDESARAVRVISQLAESSGNFPENEVILTPPVLPFSLFRALRRADEQGTKPNRSDPVNRSLKVLIAEDNPINRRVISTAFQGKGHEVALAENGQLAFEMRCRDEFDGLFMDMQMPVMDGVEATRKIREWEVRNGAPRVPIVGLTAHALNEVKRRFLDAGVDEVLTKPASIKDMIDVLSRFSEEYV